MRGAAAPTRRDILVLQSKISVLQLLSGLPDAERKHVPRSTCARSNDSECKGKVRYAVCSNRQRIVVDAIDKASWGNL